MEPARFWIQTNRRMREVGIVMLDAEESGFLIWTG